MQSGKSAKEDIRHKTQDTRHETRAGRSEVSSLKSQVLSLESLHGVVLTFGVFDGIHIGHQKVIGCVVDRAKALRREGVVVSFTPHPGLLICGEAPPALITVTQKIKLLKMLGIDRVVIEDFDKQFSQLSPEEFARDVLARKFDAREVVVGHDCAFGKDRAGDKWLLKELGEKYGFGVDVVAPCRLNGAVVSSTRIRTAILRGDLDLAYKLLGRQYSLSGPVVPGKGMGRKIGHATANLQLQRQVLPPPGVYAVKVRVGQRRLDGVLNMGIQPTFEGNEFRVEVHLLDFDETLYGQNVEVFLVKRIRDEKVFANSKELADQIKKDEAVAREILDA
jgi:riboflavin kinase/FMN adenylyltransferase